MVESAAGSAPASTAHMNAHMTTDHRCGGDGVRVLPLVVPAGARTSESGLSVVQSEDAWIVVCCGERFVYTRTR